MYVILDGDGHLTGCGLHWYDHVSFLFSPEWLCVVIKNNFVLASLFYCFGLNNGGLHKVRVLRGQSQSFKSPGLSNG